MAYLIFVNGPSGVGKNYHCNKYQNRQLGVFHLIVSELIQSFIDANLESSDVQLQTTAFAFQTAKNNGVATDPVVTWSLIERELHLLRPEVLVLVNGYPRNLDYLQQLQQYLAHPQASHDDFLLGSIYLDAPLKCCYSRRNKQTAVRQDQTLSAQRNRDRFNATMQPVNQYFASLNKLMIVDASGSKQRTQTLFTQAVAALYLAAVCNDENSV